jgi:hypothetical protein
LVAAVCLYALGGCNLSPAPLDVDIPEPEQRLVVSAFTLPPQFGLFTFTRTFSALLGSENIDLDNASIADRVLIDSAVAVIRHEGQVDTLYRLFPGIFGTLDLEQQEDVDYVLELKDCKSGQQVTARTRMLPVVGWDTLYSVVKALPNLGAEVFRFVYAFDDLPGANNYYLITYTRRSDLNGGGGLAAGTFDFRASAFEVVTDLTEGDGFKISREADFSSFEQDTLLVGLANISREYYDFLAAYKRSGNLLSSLVSEPVRLPTNVEGGFGYFALIRPTFRELILAR